MPTPDYRSPTSAAKLLRWYAGGDRDFQVDLPDAYLRCVHLDGINLNAANLERAILTGSQLANAGLCGAILSDAVLRSTNLQNSNLDGACLRHADLSDASLVAACVRDANLSHSDLRGTDLRGANLTGSNLRFAHIGDTVFVDVNLSRVEGLEDVMHLAPSLIDHRTIERMDEIQPGFLRGVGLADWQIEEAKLLQPDLTPTEITDIMYRVVELRGAYPLQVRPVFISYSRIDAAFVDALEAELSGVGIRFWRDIHDLDAGPLETQVARAQEDRVTVVVLSKVSIRSDWVEHEVRHARALAKKQERYTLCPIALDDSWKRCAWPERLREQFMEYAILDFSGWQDRKRMSEMFVKLERGLRKWYR